MVQNGNIVYMGTGTRKFRENDAVSLRIAKMIDDEREKQGISLRDLAIKTGTSHPTLSRIFSGDRVMMLPELDALCEVLGLVPWQIMKRAEEE